MPAELTVAVEIAFIALGAVLGALTFSLVIGRRRARQVAKLADRLAVAAGQPASPDLHYPDPVLDDALRRLGARIAEVETFAATDQVTRLLNRPAGVRTLATEIERANRYERPLCVALIDIDHFKRVNDTYGHAVGDEMLAHVATTLRGSVRGVDSLARYGGEEFLLVMPETGLDGGLASAENLRRLVGRSPLLVETTGVVPEVRVTISVGVASSEGYGSIDVDKLLRRADMALYGAKELGRDQVQAARAFDDDSSLTRATIDANARKRAAQIAKAAFEASNQQLLVALSERAGWAGGASELIANLSAEMGVSIGLPDSDIDRIRTASLLHDLGKLAIPDEILSKPGPLTQPEWRTIIEHPKIGQVVLEQAGAIRDAAKIVLHHHEWWDGRGYPHGLAGAEIPIGSRIVAIADAYEAMISDRPYSVAMSHRAAVDELERQAGSQFDPDLVALFIRLVGDGSRPLLRRPPESAESAAPARPRPQRNVAATTSAKTGEARVAARGVAARGVAARGVAPPVTSTSGVGPPDKPATGVGAARQSSITPAGKRRPQITG